MWMKLLVRRQSTENWTNWGTCLRTGRWMGRIHTDDMWEEKARDPLIFLHPLSWCLIHTHYTGLNLTLLIGKTTAQEVKPALSKGSGEGLRRQEQLEQGFLEKSGLTLAIQFSCQQTFQPTCLVLATTLPLALLTPPWPTPNPLVFFSYISMNFCCSTGLKY